MALTYEEAAALAAELGGTVTEQYYPMGGPYEAEVWYNIVLPSGAEIGAWNLWYSQQLSDPDLPLWQLAEHMEMAALALQGYTVEESIELRAPPLTVAPYITVPVVAAPAGAPAAAGLPRTGAQALTVASLARATGAGREPIRPSIAPGIPSPDPISIGVNIVIAIGTLWRVFGGGVAANVKRALDGIRDTITTVSDRLMRFGWQISRALGRVLSALHTIWTRVIWPVLRQLPRVIGRLRRLLERDLPRLLRLIDRIRARVLEIYERWMRPMLLVLQRMRRVLLILRLFRVRWAEQVDARLMRLQERLMYPLRVALEHLAIVEQWLNVVVSAEQLIQETIFGRSAYHYQDPLVRSVIGPFTRPMSELEKLELWPRAAAVSPEETREHLRAALRADAGPIAEDVRRAVAELRRV